MRIKILSVVSELFCGFFRSYGLRSFSLLVSAVLVGMSLSGLSQANQTIYSELNEVRKSVGMTPFTVNPELEKASYGHARYLSYNRITGHNQRRGLSGFTGVRPLDRAHGAGYRSGTVSENVAQGQATSELALEGLMAAIYHRFGFLKSDMNLVGAAVAGEGDVKSYVYLMGNAGLNRLCYGQSFKGYGRYYTSVCSPDLKIRKELYDLEKNRAAAANPEWVVWPPAGGIDIPPAFFEETPDPLPDLDVSGYPISVSVNPQKVKQARVLNFKLVDVDTGAEVTQLRVLNKKTDPNGKISAHEFSWFPLKRLKWGHVYQAELQLQLDNKRVSNTWQFKTQTLPSPAYVISGTGELLKASRSGYVTVYIPPTRGASKFGRISYRFPGGVTVESDFIDQNTLRIRVKGKPGSKVDFTTGNHKKFTVLVHGW